MPFVSRFANKRAKWAQLARYLVDIFTEVVTDTTVAEMRGYISADRYFAYP